MADLIKLDDRIASIQAQLIQLRARRQRVQARQAALSSKRSRRNDLRRKILAGAVVLSKVESGEMDAGTFREWLDRSLARQHDRALFEL